MRSSRCRRATSIPDSCRRRICWTSPERSRRRVEREAFAAAEVGRAPESLIGRIGVDHRDIRAEVIRDNRARVAATIAHQPPRVAGAEAASRIAPIAPQGPGVDRHRRAGWVRSNARRRPTPGIVVHTSTVVDVTAGTGAIFVPARGNSARCACRGATTLQAVVNAARIPRRRETSALGVDTSPGGREVCSCSRLAHRLHQHLWAKTPHTPRS
jgi:hypothetical protein